MREFCEIFAGHNRSSGHKYGGQFTRFLVNYFCTFLRKYAVDNIVITGKIVY